tara:strand:- start:205 stop:1017 length:813 start_codon:yes stop_codon:yes gene_type:complete
MHYLFSSLLRDFDNNFYKNIYIFAISFLSNTFSAISGGGAGLIQLPALILFGVPYYQALSTHKFATVALGLGGSIRNYKVLSSDLETIIQILIFGVPGVVFGASIVEYISEEYLLLVLGLFSILLAFDSFLNSDFGLLSKEIKLNFLSKLRLAVLIFIIGILNGSISSGTGLLVTILLIKNKGMDFRRAVSITFFTVGIFWNAIGAISLSKIGVLPFDLLIILLLGSFIGGFVGAHLSYLKGNKLIKNTFTFVCLTAGISLLIKSINILI